MIFLDMEVLIYGKKLMYVVGIIGFMFVTVGYDYLDYRIISFDEILEYDDKELSAEENEHIREMASDEAYIRDADEFSSQKAYYKYLEYRGNVDFLSEGYDKAENLDNVFCASGLSRAAATNVSATLRVTLNGITR